MLEEEAITPEQFFAECPASTTGLEGVVEAFVARHVAQQRPVVCVTSGGTTVPLERRCVRFVDNFSGGTRGALSVEQFLQAGCAVIFLYRKGSIQPFTKGLPSSQLLDCLTGVLVETENNGGIQVIKEAEEVLRTALQKARECNEEHTLLRIPFMTLFEYLQYLKYIAICMKPCGRWGAFFLAAAVSDFYMPWSRMGEHKIQSSEGPLNLRLAKVPKMLGLLRDQWAPEAFVVSFKLETDNDLLIKKALRSIQSYKVHAVVANILETRMNQVLLVQRSSDGQAAVQTINRNPTEQFIERPLVEQVLQLHRQYHMPAAPA